MGLRAWLWAKLDMPAYEAARVRRHRSWDHAQANDWATLETDPAKDEVTEAAALLDRDPDRAFASLLAFAQQGSVWSMVNIGWCFEVGRGAAVSSADAEYWYRRAYEAGCDRALIEYGRMLGARGAVDLQQQVYAAGAARNWPPAMQRSAQLELRYARTLEEHLKLKPVLERAVELGSPGARRVLAWYLVHGRFGVRNVPAGLRLAYAIFKDGLAEIGRESEQRTEEAEAAPLGATLH